MSEVPKALVVLGLCLMALCKMHTAVAAAEKATGPLQKRQPQTMQKAPVLVVGKTTLEVQLGTKEFEAWGTTATITKPQFLTFRWSVKPPNATSGTWRVLDRVPIPIKKRSAAIAPKELAQGKVQAPPPGGHATFQINFAAFIPKWPPVAPGVYSYSVSIRPQDAANQATGPKSAAVKIDYKAPGPPPTFNLCTKTSDCPTGEVCNPQKQECGPLMYTCKDGHIIVGTDGTASDCSPYRCVANTCRTSCGSVDDCHSPYVCNSMQHCIYPH